MGDRPFDRLKDCACCKREIDEVTVFLKKITIGGDSYRHHEALQNATFKYEKLCKECHQGPSKGVKDVYYGYGSGTHTEENICDPKTGQPIPFSSKQGKWDAMQKAGVREAGDRIHGARTTFSK